MTRRIIRELEGLTGAVSSYQQGRQAFLDGVTFTALPLSSQSLVKSGWLDALADQAQALGRALGMPGWPREPAPEAVAEAEAAFRGLDRALTADGDPLPQDSVPRRPHAAEADE